jgi:hypothetical protein
MKSHLSPAALAAMLSLTAVAGASIPDHAAFEGAWQLKAPQPTLTPAGGGEPPFTEQGRKMYEANQAAAAKGDYSFDSTTTICSSPGVPRLQIAPMLIKLFIRPQINVIVFLYEWNGLFRPIDTSGQRREPPPIGSKKILSNRAQQDLLFGTMTGKSYGHWEREVLVVESDGFSDQKLLDNYLPDSEDLKVTEHIRLVNRDTLEDRISINDPQIFTRPWDAIVTYKRQSDRAFEEYVCLDHLRAGEKIWPH